MKKSKGLFECSECGIILTTPGSVTRKYVGSKGSTAFGLGHFTSDGTFDPEDTVPRPDGDLTFEGYNACTACGSKIS